MQAICKKRNGLGCVGITNYMVAGNERNDICKSELSQRVSLMHDVVISKVLRLLDTKKGHKVAAVGPLIHRKFGKLPQMPLNIYPKSFMHVGQWLPTVTGRPVYYSHLDTSEMTTQCIVPIFQIDHK